MDAETDHIKGPPDAPLTLVEYADFECPFCARATGVTREPRERFGRDLRYVFRYRRSPTRTPHAELAVRAAVAADAQGRFWQMHDLLFTHQDQLEFEDIAGYAAEPGLDVETFLRAGAEAGGARGTPTFFVGGRRHTGPHDAQTLARELDAPGSGPPGP